MNEEGLPIIDITEPASDLSSEWHPPNPFVTEQDPAPLSSLNGQERLSLRARTNRILDILEAEEEQEESDDEGDDLGDTMLCMYDKVQRVKNKWSVFMVSFTRTKPK